MDCRQPMLSLWLLNDSSVAKGEASYGRSLCCLNRKGTSRLASQRESRSFFALPNATIRQTRDADFYVARFVFALVVHSHCSIIKPDYMRRTHSFMIPRINVTNIHYDANLVPLLPVTALSLHDAMLLVLTRCSIVVHGPSPGKFPLSRGSVVFGIANNAATSTSLSVESLFIWSKHNVRFEPAKSVLGYGSDDAFFFGVFGHCAVIHHETFRLTALRVDNYVRPGAINLFWKAARDLLCVWVLAVVRRDACSTRIVSFNSPKRYTILRDCHSDFHTNSLDRPFFHLLWKFRIYKICNLLFFVVSSHEVHDVDTAFVQNSWCCHGQQHRTETNVCSIKPPPFLGI
mmetsp:Transcript_23209/g.64540  ORF Transcript_23209/g.64540 Transcript_23209/m.64540 type:complete len:345 (+) Transcript_23209:41-1075(+)